MEWKFVGVVPDGREFKIQDVNVWSKKWNAVKNEVAHVQGPSYKQPFAFQVYTIINDNVIIKFAAGEFSNCVWGFYVPAND